MYNRYRIEMEFDELWHAARSQSDMTKRASPTMEVFPDKPGPVIRNNAYDQRELMNPTGGMPSPPTVTPGTCSVVSAAIVVARPLSLPAFAERLFRLLAVKVPIPMACGQVLARTPSDISVSRGDAASPVSPQASRSFLVTSKEKLHTSRTPTPDAFRWERHHLGIRGRLFLGIGGRDHFGIRGRIASEFASYPTTSYPSWA